MTEEISYIPEPPESFEGTPEKKKKTTLWIIIVILAVILLCCCLVVVLVTVFGFTLEEFESYLHLLPYFRLI